MDEVNQIASADECQTQAAEHRQAPHHGTVDGARRAIEHVVEAVAVGRHHELARTAGHVAHRFPGGDTHRLGAVQRLGQPEPRERDGGDGVASAEG